MSRIVIDPGQAKTHLKQKKGVILGTSLRLGITATIGGTALLFGCKDKSNTPIPDSSPASPAFVKSLSSEPRNCKVEPAKEQIMSNDGVSKGTRIITIGDVILFVPLDWLSGYLVDDVNMNSVSPNSFSAFTGKFTPDLRRNECPNIVHRFAVGERASRYGGMGFRITALPQSVMTSQDQSLPRVKEVIVGAQQDATPPLPDAFLTSLVPGRWTKVRNFPTYKMPDTSSAHGLCTATRGTPASEWVISRYITPTVSTGVVVDASSAEPSPEWTPYCKALYPLFQWLTTPPSDRRNQN